MNKKNFAELLEENKGEIYKTMEKCSRLSMQYQTVFKVYLSADGSVFYDEFVSENSWKEYDEPVFFLYTFHNESTDILDDYCNDKEEIIQNVLEQLTPEEKTEFEKMKDDEDLADEYNENEKCFLKKYFEDAYQKSEECYIDFLHEGYRETFDVLFDQWIEEAKEDQR